MLLFTADWHFKLGQKNVPKSWALDRYNKFFDIINNTCLEHSISTHIIGGDLFDRVPSMEELQLYFQFLRGVNTPTIIFDGNHEATRKNQTFFNFLKEITSVINPRVSIITETTDMGAYTILPYCDLHKKDSIEKCDHTKPLMTHVRGEIPPHVQPEVDLDRFKEFPIVYTGDLHSHSNSQRNLVYPGSPMTIGFHRNKVKTGGLLIEEDNLTKWKWIEFKLPQLIRLTIKNEKDMVATPYDHTVYEIEGDMSSLSTISNNDLLDKKIITRNSVSKLDLTKTTSVEEEIYKYMEEILHLPSDVINNVMKEFNATATQIRVG